MARYDTREPVEQGDAPDDDGNEFASFVEQELDFEMRRADRAEAQGQRLVTGSSTLVTLAFTGTALVTGREGFDLPRLTVWAVIPATLCLLLAAWFGIRASRVSSIRRASVGLLRKWDKEASPTTMWTATAVEARAAITDTKITALESLRTANNRKLGSAVWGGRAQGAGLFFLTVASIATLLHSAMPGQAWWLDMLKPIDG